MRTALLITLLIISSVGRAQESYMEGELLLLLKHESSFDDLVVSFENQYRTPLRLERRLAQSMPLFWVSFDSFVVATKEALRFSEQSELVSIAQLNHTNIKTRTTPNDQAFNEQWHLFNNGSNGGSGQADMDALSAWDIATGGITPGGDTIVVAVIDGGYNLIHPDLQQNIFVNHAEIPGNFIDDDNNGYVDDISGWNVYNNSGSHFNDNHGNHVAGIIGAKGNNNTGVSGVNWDVKILPISGSSSNDATVAAAYGYVLDMRRRYEQTNGAEGAYIVSTNSSFGVDFGNPASYPLWCAMYDSLGYAGIISAGATANTNNNIDQVGDVPTACPSNFLLSVTNTTSNDTKNNNAAYGLTTIDLGAPGTSIYSTLVTGYGDLTGTSMATPQVAGAVALMYNALCSEVWEAYDANPAGLALYIKNKLLTEGVKEVNALNNITVTGGRLDLYKAVRSVADSCFAVVLDVTNTSCGACDGSIAMSVLGGVSPYTYHWSTGSNDSLELDSLCAGQYTVTVIDALGDSSIATTSISDSAGPLVNVDKADVSCFSGADGQATLIGAQNYSWPDGDTVTTRSDLEAGIYFVSASEAGNPCTTIVTVNIGQPEDFIIEVTTAVPSPLTASNGSINVNVSGATPPYVYEWGDGSTGSTLTGLPIGIHTLTITDARGCQKDVELLLGYPAGIDDRLNNMLSVFPNPTQDMLYVNLEANTEFEAVLHDISGRILMRNFASQNQLRFDLTGLEAGTYILSVSSVEGTFRQKIQKVN